MLADQSELGPDHTAAADEIEPDGDVAVRRERPFQRGRAKLSMSAS
jgi:hypothetical protein